jgi:hypothetical protein
MSKNGNAQELYLFATNDGQLYPRALRLAREKASLNRWVLFAFDAADKRLAAKKLKAYYERHVRESSGDRRSRRPYRTTRRAKRRTYRRR